MKISIACYPPLGQLTQVPPGPVAIHAVLNVDPHRARELWEVCLWHSIDGKEWLNHVLTPSPTELQPSCLQEPDASIHRMYLNAEVYAERTIYFTFKVRHGPDSGWKWIQDETKMNDAIVLIKQPYPRPFSHQLKDYIPDLNAALVIHSVSSQSPRTELWSLETSVPGGQNDAPSNTDIELGTAWGGSFLRWFALVRLWQPWIGPRHGKTVFELDKDAIMCAFQNAEGKHLVVLGVSGLNNVTTVLRHGDNGKVVMRVRNDGEGSEAVNVLLAVGDEFDNTLAAAMYQARSMVMRAREVDHEKEREIMALNDDFKSQWIEMWYDGLGFCTWNALGQQLTADKIYQALDTLADNDVNITSLIIDDNWQSVDYKGNGQFQYGLMDFQAEPSAFPDGLQTTVHKIRSKHPTIRHIAVWHALLGYWGGINPEGKIGKTYKTIEVLRDVDQRRNLPLGGKMNIVAKQDVHRFYDQFYRFLRSCGVDGVKTDGQFMTDMWMSSKVRRDHIKTYLDAWTLSTLRYFGSRAISCMAQTPTILYYSQLASNRPSFVCRNSDDFFPQVPSSHPWHVWTNAHNTLLTQHLNILPDWDMFQTVHDYSGFHAAARCVSGGPIYITDVPGQHNMGLLKQMTGVTTRGKTAIFRPSVLGRSIDAYVGYHDDILLKVGSYHGRSGTGTPILAAFNISNRHLTELIPLSRFPGVVPDVHYVVRAHTTRLVTNPIQSSTAESLLASSLDVRGYEIFTAYPLTSFEGERDGMVWIGTLGLVDKMASGATIVNSDTRIKNGRMVIDARLKALGIAGFYISMLPSLSITNDFMVTILDQAIPPHTVRVSKTDEHVLEIDVEAAWKEMGLRPIWSNDLELKVYFNFK